MEPAWSAADNRPLKEATTPADGENVGARLAYLEGLLVQSGIPLSSASGATGVDVPATPFAPRATPTGLAQGATGLGHATMASTPAPAILPSRVFNLEAGSPVHTMRGMPALAAAVDMVDDRSDAPTGAQAFSQTHSELASLPDAPSLHSVYHGASGTSGGGGGSGLGEVEQVLDASPHDLGSVPADPDDDEGIGTLVMFPSGRAKFLGRTAGSEWLKNVSCCSLQLVY